MCSLRLFWFWLGSPRPDVFSTEGFCPRLLEVNNSVEWNVIRRITRVDTNEICSNFRNLAGDGLVSNERKKDVLPLECIQHRLEFFHGGDSTSGEDGGHEGVERFFGPAIPRLHLRPMLHRVNTSVAPVERNFHDA